MSAAGAAQEQAGRAELFERWITEHQPALRRIAAAYERDPGTREDLYQDICLAVWRALPSFRGEASVRTFLFRIAHNRATTHATRRRTLTGGDWAAAEAVPDPRPGADDNLAAGERRLELVQAMHRLPLLLRQVLILTLEDASQREIAEVLGVRENTVAARVSRARSALRRMLGTSGGGR